ncbi:exonuclease domain-containing protein [Candidatus Lokiarchaeum ossiferum]|uniref:exonuclease domain-containing protein n=1 Tax=Candidatus Lokiarchaeum ossiferum TaxID=2951803 RepID=UPI00352C990B
MKIAVLDIETTGRTPKTGTIVEIGICLLDLKSHFKSKLFDSTCREVNFDFLHEEKLLENAWVFQNSSLTIEDVRNGPTWEYIKPKIQKILSKFPVTAYNKQFDFGFLQTRGIKIRKELDCPMIKATPVLKIPGFYDEYKWPSVQEAWEYFFPNRKDYMEEHRAYDDALHEADIVKALYDIGAWKAN